MYVRSRNFYLCIPLDISEAMAGRPVLAFCVKSMERLLDGSSLSDARVWSEVVNFTLHVSCFDRQQSFACKNFFTRLVSHRMRAALDVLPS